jgi:hypothetical protein
MGKKYQDPDPGTGSGMNNPDHISKSLETIFWVKILKFFDADPGFGMEKTGIWDPGCLSRIRTLTIILFC